MDAEDVKAEESSERGSYNHKNGGRRRKRDRFLRNAKAFGLKNIYGQGAEMDQEQYNYLVQIAEAMSRQEDEEERQLIANNVVGQLTGKEIRSASNQLGSRVLENLLPFTDEQTFSKLMDTFAENFRVVCCDRFASHVLQRMLYVALLRSVATLQEENDEAEQGITQESKKTKQARGRDGVERGAHCTWPYYEYNLKAQFGDEHQGQCKMFVQRLAKFVLNNLEEFVWDRTANYIVQQCILNLAGIAEHKMSGRDRGNQAPTRDQTKMIVHEEWQKLLTKFNKRLLAWPQFADLASNELTSLIVQNLLRALSATNDHFQVEQLASKLYYEAFRAEENSAKKEEEQAAEQVEENVCKVERGDLPKAFEREASTRLLEVCISVAPSGLLRESIFEGLFRGNLEKLSQSRAHNFAVQKLIDHTNDKDVVEIVLVELEKAMENILRVGHSGILLALAKKCAQLSCHQGKFVKILLDALHCGEVTPDKLLTSILHLVPAHITLEKPPRISLHGSLIIQAVLDFNKPIKFVNAILGTASEQLAAILSDPRGSFIANAFIESRFVGEKSREKMVRHLEGQYSQLVATPHGSRVVEIMFHTGNPAQRENIVRELADRCAQLNSNVWGIAINKRLLVDTYKRDPARWKVAIKSDAKVQKMFDKLVTGVKRKATKSE